MSLISRIFIVAFCCSFFAKPSAAEPSAAEPSSTSLRDLERIDYLRAQSPSSLVRDALWEEAAFRDATKREVEWYLSTIQSSFSASRRSLGEVSAAVLKRMKSDLSTVKRLNQEFALLSPLRNEITFSCKANRLVEILEVAIPFYEKNAYMILSGVMPVELDGYFSRVRCLGVCEGHEDKHNALDLALKAALVLTKLEIEGQAHVVDEAVKALRESAFVHTTPLPRDRMLEGIQTLSMFYNGTLSPSEGELVFVHGGYAFGGQDQDTSAKLFGPFGKPFGPQDCSSWVSKILGLPKIMSTVDFAAYHRDHEHAYLECSATNEFVVIEEVQKLEPVVVRSIHDLLPGMILLTRKYDLAKDPSMQTLGNSGHVQLIVDVDAGSNSLLTLEYARNLPDYEGFGVRRVPFSHNRDEKVMVFQQHASSFMNGGGFRN